MYKKWKDDELLKTQERNWMQLARNEIYIVAFWVVLVYLVAKNDAWWLLCIGAGLAAFLVFIYLLLWAAAKVDDQMGIR